MHRRVHLLATNVGAQVHLLATNVGAQTGTVGHSDQSTPQEHSSSLV
jgi:hypothetical protein